eukprot:gene15330-2766_t
MPRPSSAPWERDEASYRNPVASGAYAPAVNSKAPFATDTSRRPAHPPSGPRNAYKGTQLPWATNEPYGGKHRTTGSSRAHVKAQGVSSKAPWTRDEAPRLPTAKHIRVPGAGRPGAKPWEKTPLSTTGADNTIVSENGGLMLNPKVGAEELNHLFFREVLIYRNSRTLQGTPNISGSIQRPIGGFTLPTSYLMLTTLVLRSQFLLREGAEKANSNSSEHAFGSDV